MKQLYSEIEDLKTAATQDEVKMKQMSNEIEDFKYAAELNGAMVKHMASLIEDFTRMGAKSLGEEEAKKTNKQKTH